MPLKLLMDIIFRLVLLVSLVAILTEAKDCKPKARAAPTATGNEILDPSEDSKSARKPVQTVFFWPSMNDNEKAILRDAFFQIGRRTCIKFEEQEFKPWYHADRWNAEKPYVLIRKSKKYAAYSDNKVEGLVDRTVLYMPESVFQHDSFNHSRGAVMDQLVRYMGMKREIYRPDATSYVQPVSRVPLAALPVFHPNQLEWPFDPESITVPLWAREKYRLTQYCPARNDADIGAGQRVGLLTRWDTIKLNSMFCPELVPKADPHRGPCVVPRSKDVDEFRKRVWAYKRLLSKQKKNTA